MKLDEFIYNGKKREVYTLGSDEYKQYGIDVSLMSDEERERFSVIAEKFYNDMKNFEKYYRQFSHIKKLPIPRGH